MRGCLFCLRGCPDVPQVPKGGIFGAVHCKSLERSLYQHFIITKVLGISKVWCERFIKRKVRPRCAFGICQRCTQKVHQAWTVYQQIIGLETKLEELKKGLKGVMLDNIKNKLRRKNFVCVENEIRTLLFPKEMKCSETDSQYQNAKSTTMAKPHKIAGAGDGATDEVDWLDDDGDDICILDEKIKRRKTMTRYVGANANTTKEAADQQNEVKVRKLYKCEVCQPVIRFIGEESYQEHVDLHTKSKEQGLECPDCFFPANNKDELESHKYSKHDSVTPKRPFVCGKCDFKGKSHRILKAHTEEEHPDTPLEELGPDVQLKCDPCSKIFETPSGLMTHQKRAHPEMFGVAFEPVKCDKCDVVAASSILLKYHIQRSHPHSAFMCDFCGKSFSKSQSLTLHITTVHKTNDDDSAKVDKEQCHLCGVSYANKKILRRHIAKFHPDNSEGDPDGSIEGEEFSCKYCDLKFVYKIALINHTKEHKKVQCELCPRTYLDVSSMKFHMKLNHTENQETPCPHCRKVFPNPVSMHAHTVHHCQMKILNETGHNTSTNNFEEPTEIKSDQTVIIENLISTSDQNVSQNQPPSAFYSMPDVVGTGRESVEASNNAAVVFHHGDGMHVDTLQQQQHVLRPTFVLHQPHHQ